MKNNKSNHITTLSNKVTEDTVILNIPYDDHKDHREILTEALSNTG